MIIIQDITKYSPSHKLIRYISSMSSDQLLSYYNNTAQLYDQLPSYQSEVQSKVSNIVDMVDQVQDKQKEYQYGAYLSSLKNIELEQQHDILQNMEGSISNKSRVIQETDHQGDYQDRQIKMLVTVCIASVLLIPCGILFRYMPIAGYILLFVLIIGLFAYYKYVWTGYDDGEKDYNKIAYETAQYNIDHKYDIALEEQRQKQRRQQRLAKLCRCMNPNGSPPPPSSALDPDGEERPLYDPKFKVHKMNSDPGFIYMDTNGPVERISPPMSQPDKYGTIVQKYNDPTVVHHYTIQ